MSGAGGPGVDPVDSGDVDPTVIPDRIAIVPDDYHTPHAGTAADGRRFFVSDELFAVTGTGEIVGFVATFLWTPEGEFDELRVSRTTRDARLPPGQPHAGPDGSELEHHLAELGELTLEPILVEPFAERLDELPEVEFGLVPTRYEDGTAVVELQPGNVLAYYAPWDGLEYDT